LLKDFEVTVHAIDLHPPTHWDVTDLPDRLDQLIIGDYRLPDVLEQAQIQHCQSILLVSRHERTNLEVAFTARSLNPSIRLVVRSSQERLNQLLSQQLGNFIAFDISQLPAVAFALAALGGSTYGLFTLEHQLFKVSGTEIGPTHHWCNTRLWYELNTSTRRLLSCGSAQSSSTPEFYQWDPTRRIQAGDRVTYIEIGSGAAWSNQPLAPATQSARRWLQQTNIGRYLKQKLGVFRQFTQNTPAVYLAAVMISLLVLAVLLYKLNDPAVTWQDALNTALILLLGGYGDVWGGVQLPVPLSWWLQLFSFGFAIAGTILIGIVYATLTERLLATRLQFLSRRPAVPQHSHVILVGMGRLGQRVATLLQELKQPVVGIVKQPPDAEILPNLPLVVGDLSHVLDRVNLPMAKSIVVLTDDELSNLEMGLVARTANPRLSLVLRTLNPRFTESISQLLPYATALESNSLAAEAFATAAFGENVLNLFRLNNQTILVTEYRIEANDTLNGLLLAAVAYGYGVVPILHQRQEHDATPMPGDDLRLQVDDRLVVLATITGLKRIEQGDRLLPRWQVCVESVLYPGCEFEGGSAIARISGCDLSVARGLMHQLPATLELPLYQHQALRLIRELRKVQVRAHLRQLPCPE
jgi:Trk K+ transport system NAD-binding subunit